MKEKWQKSRIIKLLLIQSAMACVLTGVFFAVRGGGISIPCLFLHITGFKCPGCGTTRAILSCSRLDFAAAIRYNYLFPLEIAYVAWVWISTSYAYLKTGYFRYDSPSLALDISVAAAVMIWWVLRNILGI